MNENRYVVPILSDYGMSQPFSHIAASPDLKLWFANGKLFLLVFLWNLNDHFQGNRSQYAYNQWRSNIYIWIWVTCPYTKGPNDLRAFLFSTSTLWIKYVFGRARHPTSNFVLLKQNIYSMVNRFRQEMLIRLGLGKKSLLKMVFFVTRCGLRNQVSTFYKGHLWNVYYS